MNTQTTSILRHLQQGRTLNPLQAWRLFHCYRLGARIFELRKQGHKVKTSRKGKQGFAEYRLEKKKKKKVKDSKLTWEQWASSPEGMQKREDIFAEFAKFAKTEVEKINRGIKQKELEGK